MKSPPAEQEGSGKSADAAGQGGIGGLADAAEALDKLRKIPHWLAVTVRYQGRVITKVRPAASSCDQQDIARAVIPFM